MSQSLSYMIQRMKPYWLDAAVAAALFIWGKIVLMHPNAPPAEMFDPDDAGLAVCIAAAGAGDSIWMPPGTWTVDFTVPDNVAIASMTNNTILTGQVTLGDYSSIKGITIERTANDANLLVGIISNGANEAWINDCTIKLVQSGSGNAIGISITGTGITWIFNTSSEATSVSGSGYGISQTAGTCYISDDGYIHGSTQDILGIATLFDFSDEIKLFDSGGANTKIYPPINAGLTAALAAANSGDIVLLPMISITGGPWTIPVGVTVASLAYQHNQVHLVGNITNNGTMTNLNCRTNLTNNGHILLCHFENNGYIGAGDIVTQTGSILSKIEYSTIDNYRSGVWSLYITKGSAMNVIGGFQTAGANGVYMNGTEADNCRLWYCRFMGRIGGQIENAGSVNSCEFRSEDIAAGISLYHTAGTGIVNNSEMVGSLTGSALVLTAAGLEMRDCNWDDITGINFLSYGQGDRGSYDPETYHASDIEAAALTRHLPQPTGDPGDAGKTAILDAGGDYWELGFTAATSAGAFPDDPYSELVAWDGYAGWHINPNQYRWNVLTSWKTGATIYQAITYWNADGHLVIGKRVLDGAWTLYTYDGSGGLPDINVPGNDNHDIPVIGIDPNGYIHLCYSMHVDALIYRKSNVAINAWAGALGNLISMLGTNEGDVTYPTFVNDPAGALYFIFRDGGSGDGDLFMYKYNHAATTWAGVAGTVAGKVINGKDSDRSPYWFHPAFDDDFGSGGNFHLAWGWHQALVYTSYNVSYVAWDGANWTQADGAAQVMPITPANCEVVDAVAAGNGLTAFNAIGCDSDGHPHLAYPKLGADGFRHLYHAWHTGAAWVILQVTTSESPDKTNLDSLVDLAPAIVIDKADDTVYIFYVDHFDVEGILFQRSAPGDYTTWERFCIFPRAVGWWSPKLDYVEWERETIAYFPVEYWDGGLSTSEDSFPIRLLRWEPWESPTFDPADIDEQDLVTLDADAAVILDLTGQVIGLDTQAANTVFAGPATGAANEPTFRVLVEADLPAEAVLESELNSTVHQHTYQEDHTAECDGAATKFFTANQFEEDTTMVWLNGLLQRPDIDYTEDATLDAITFATAPENGDTLIVAYIVDLEI